MILIWVVFGGREVSAYGCMDHFGNFYFIQFGIVLAQAAYKLKLSCLSRLEETTRRQIKNQTRISDLIFFVLFSISLGLLVTSYVLDRMREECQGDARLAEFTTPAHIILTVSGVQTV